MNKIVKEGENTVHISVLDTDGEAYYADLCCFTECVMSNIGLKSKSVSLSMVSNEYMQELNYRYRKTNTVTDVLSFSQLEGGEVPDATMLGDVVCAPEYIKTQAATLDIPFKEEMRRCVVHSILHLIGMTHHDRGMSDIASSKMLLLQEKLLQSCNGETEL